MTLREAILEKVTELQGCKATELPSEIGEYLSDRSEGSFNEVLEKLIKEKKIVEVEYILPKMDYRVKSFLLPGKTQVLHRS